MPSVAWSMHVTTFWPVEWANKALDRCVVRKSLMGAPAPRPVARASSACRRLVGRGADDDRPAVLPGDEDHGVVDRPEGKQSLASQGF